MQDGGFDQTPSLSLLYFATSNYHSLRHALATKFRSPLSALGQARIQWNQEESGAREQDRIPPAVFKGETGAGDARPSSDVEKQHVKSVRPALSACQPAVEAAYRRGVHREKASAGSQKPAYDGLERGEQKKPQGDADHDGPAQHGIAAAEPVAEPARRRTDENADHIDHIEQSGQFGRIMERRSVQAEGEVVEDRGEDAETARRADRKSVV